MGMNSPCVNCCADSKVCKGCDWYNGIWIPKDQYEQRLKANVIAMLEEIQLEIEEKGIDLCDNGWYLTYSDIIQQKIDTLKE